MDQRSAIEDFRMPRFREIPNVGLYLEQTVKYINECLAPLRVTVTSSMLSNYVKQGYITRPVRKQYYADQIAYLFFMALAKQVLSIENIGMLFRLQQKTYSVGEAYDYFCSELEDTLQAVFHEKAEGDQETQGAPDEKKILKSVVIAISHVIYLDRCLEKLQEQE